MQALIGHKKGWALTENVEAWKQKKPAIGGLFHSTGETLS